MTDELKIKRDRVAGWLAARGLRGVVLTRRCNFSWFTCGAHNHVGEACDVGVSSLVAAADRAVVVANNIEAARLAGEELPAGVDVIEYPYHDGRARHAAFAKAMGPGRFALDVDVDGVNGAPVDGEFDRLRWSFVAPEVRRYRQVCLDTARCVEAAAREIEPGMSELHIAGVLGAKLRGVGLLPWVLLVGCDERIDRFRHPLPTGKPLEARAMLVTVAERGGQLAAASRLAAFGPVSEELAARHRAVATVDAALICSTVPGASLGRIFATAQKAYADVGFADEWRLHHQGGSIGYLPREVKASPGCRTEALAGQPFAWNPSITGTKCEDTILCTDHGPEMLTDTRQWPLIRAEWNGGSLDRPDILSR